MSLLKSIIKIASTVLVLTLLGYSSIASARFLSADPMGANEHVQRYQDNLRRPAASAWHPPLEINPYAVVANNPLRWVDPTGHAIWKAVQTGGQFITAGGYHFDMTSECVNGKRVRARVLAVGPGAGFGAEISGTRESATFEDSLLTPDASVFDGLFLYAGAGLSIPPKQSNELGMRLAGAKNPPHGVSASAIRLGGARALDAGFVRGFDFGIGFLIGSSTVLDSYTEDCTCSTN